MELSYEADSDAIAQSVFEELRFFEENKNNDLNQLLPISMHLSSMEPKNATVQIEIESISEPFTINQPNDLPNCSFSNSFHNNSKIDHEASFEYSFESESTSFATLSFEHVTSENQSTNESQKQIDIFFDSNDNGANVTISNGQTYQNLTTSTGIISRIVHI